MTGREAAYALRGRLDRVMSSGRYEEDDALSVVSYVLGSFPIRDALEAAGRRHAYETTAVLAMLAWARREGGALPSAEFLWLRKVDRTLWYAMNGLGRHTHHAERLCVMAHYEAEIRVGMPLPDASVEKAKLQIHAFVDEVGPVLD